MDFHSLARRELQCLCKKNKIPANMTNIAMADSLAALQHVEGIEELMNLQSPARVGASVPQTGSRTSARRKPTREVEVSQPLTQARGARSRTAGNGDQENKNANVPITPAIPISRRRAPAASACRKLDAQMEEDEEVVAQKLPETPAVTSSRRRAPVASASVKTYSTRRSVKLLEATMAELSLDNGGKSKAVKTDLSTEVAEDSSEVSDVVHEVEEMKDAIGSDVSMTQESDEKLDKLNVHEAVDENESDNVQTLEESDEKLDESNVHEAVDETGADDVSVTELSSEANKLEVAAEVLDEGLVVESIECAEEVCENLVGQDFDEHSERDSDEERGDGSNVTDQNTSEEVVLALALPEDSDLKSDCTIEEEKDGGIKVATDEVVRALALPVDMENFDSESDFSTEEEKDMEDSDSESDCTIEEEKDDGSNVATDEVVQAVALPVDMEDSDSESDLSTEEEKDMEDSDSESDCSTEEERDMEDSDLELDCGIEEEKDDRSKVTDDEVVQALGLPVDMEDSDFQSDCSVENEEDDDSKVSDQSPDLSEANQTPVLEDKVDSEIVFKKEGSDSEKLVEEAKLNLPTPKTPSSVKQTPSRSKLSADQVTVATPLKPLADETQLPYQFPRPTKSTPKKPSSQIIPLVSDDKENIESNAANKVEAKAKNNKLVDPNTSMRKLVKMLKEHTINVNDGDKKNAVQQCEKVRTALQALPENQMVAAEPEKI